LRIVSFLFFVLVAACTIYPQVNDRGEPTDESAPCFSTRINNQNTKWYRQELGRFSICIPENLVRRRTDRCGEKCYIFENEEMYFDADTTVSAWRPTFEKRYPSFSAAARPIDGKTATIWYFEDSGKYKFVAGANIVFERGQIGMGVYLFAKSSDPKSIADRMFNSIKFK
jgi:hypothetical protein